MGTAVDCPNPRPLLPTAATPRVVIAAVLTALGAAASFAAPAAAQSDDATRRALTPQPPQPPPQVVPQAVRPLGGVPAKFPTPHRGGSLLTQRLRPMPYPVTPIPQPVPQPCPPRPCSSGYDRAFNPTTTTIAPVVAANGEVIRPGLTVNNGRFGLDADSTRRFLRTSGGITLTNQGVDLSGDFRKFSYCIPTSYYGYPFGFFGYRSYASTYPVYDVYAASSPIFRTVDPAVLSNAAPAPYRDPAANQFTEIDLAEAALAAREYDRAAALFRAHIRLAPSDIESPRALAAAVLLSGDAPAAATLLSAAHRRAPELAAAASPVGLDASSPDFRAAVSRLMDLAARRPTPETLFAAAVAKQWEGQPLVALRMLTRAQAAGFDRLATDALRANLVGQASGKP